MMMNWQFIIRVLTAVVICLVCVPTVFKGAGIARFAAAEMRLGPTQDGVEALKGWRDTTGVAADARDPARLPMTGDELNALTRQSDALKDYLALKPLSPVRWLALADAEMSLGDADGKAVRAYAMSQVTGPYEGYLMGRRAVLGALLWEKLDPDQHIGAARDLSLANITGPQETVLRGIMDAKPKSTRDSVRFEMLQIEGLQADRLARLGLQ